MNLNAPSLLRFDEDIPPIDNCRVLVIDDNLLTCKLIRTRLEIEGISNIEVAHDGKQGLEMLEVFAPDLVILDIQMPILDGREVLGLIRSKPKYDSVPVIVESALAGDIDQDELIELGATNIVTKPLDHNLLAMRVRVHLEHKLLITNLRAYRKRLSLELDLARDMQTELLPSAAEIDRIAEKHGLSIESVYLPSSELGGDFWTIRSIDEHRLALMMIDFAGHGIGASINTFRLNMILSNISPAGKTPGQFLERLNTDLCRLLRPTDFATALFGFVDMQTRSFAYAAAGSPPPVTANPATGDVSIGNSRGVPLGINPAARYEDRRLEIQPDTALVLFSDAFPETPGRDGKLLGIDAMVKLITEGFSHSAQPGKSIDGLLNRFKAATSAPPNDDLTLLCLRTDAPP